MDCESNRTIDQVISEALARSTGHLSDAAMAYTNFCLGLKSVTPANQLDKVVRVLADFRGSNANNDLSFGEAEAEVKQKMSQQLDLKRGFNSVRKGLESIGITLTNDEVKILKQYAPKLISEGFQVVTLKDKWIQAELKADDAENVTYEQITNAYQTSPGQWSSKLNEFSRLPRNGDFDNPYLAKKGLKAIAGKAFCSGDRVIAPVQSAFSGGEVRSWQNITEKGKRFEKGIKTTGLYYPAGDLQNAEIVLICEGLATAETLHQATGIPTVAAMSCGNILKVIAGISHWESYGTTEFLLCGDGLTDKKMAEICQIAKAGTESGPEDERIEVRFITPKEIDNYDFNDLYCAEGLEAVKALVDAGLKLFDAPLPLVEHKASNPDYTTDLRVAERFLVYLKGFGYNLKYCTTTGCFMVWKGQWVEDDDNQLLSQLYNEFITGELREATTLIGQEGAARKIQQTAALGNLKKKDNVTSFLKELPSIPCKTTDFDANPYLLQVPTKEGARVIDLKNGEARAVQPSDMCHRITGVQYDPKATCDDFLDVLNKASCGDEGLVNYLQCWAGCFTVGHNYAEELAIWFGSGANYKSTIKETIKDVLGSYAAVALPSLLLAKKAGAPTNDLARLAGVRAVFLSESDDGDA